jgi:hypothetical protein
MVRYTISPPAGRFGGTTIMDYPYNYITCGDNAKEADNALGIAIKSTSFCHVIFHKFAPDSGGVSLEDFKSHINKVAEAVKNGSIKVITPLDLVKMHKTE